MLKKIFDLAPVFAIFVMCCGFGFAQGLPGVGQEPFSQVGVNGDQSGGLRLFLAMVREQTVFDSVWLRFEMYNRNELPFNFTPLKGPEVELVKTGKPPIRRALALLQDTSVLELKTLASPKEPFCKFTFDIKALFGPLEEGDYSVQIIWPKDRFAITGDSDLRKLDELRSPVHQFSVRKTTLDAARQAMPAYTLITRNDPPNPFQEGKRPVGQIKNTTNEAIWICYKENADKAGPSAPLRVPFALLQWKGTSWSIASWATIAAAPEGSLDLPRYRLGPGESVTVLLPDALLAGKGDGIFLYRLDFFRMPGTGPVGLGGQIYSEPFLIDNVKPIPEKK